MSEERALHAVVASGLPYAVTRHGRVGRAPRERAGHSLRLPRADTLRRIADFGAHGFYDGPVADAIAADMVVK